MRRQHEPSEAKKRKKKKEKQNPHQLYRKRRDHADFICARHAGLAATRKLSALRIITNHQQNKSTRISPSSCYYRRACLFQLVRYTAQRFVKKQNKTKKNEANARQSAGASADDVVNRHPSTRDGDVRHKINICRSVRRNEQVECVFLLFQTENIKKKIK